MVNFNERNRKSTFSGTGSQQN